MRILWLSVLLLGLPILGAACRQAPEQGGWEAIEQASSRWEEIYNSGDATALAGLYTEDAIALPPNTPMVRGRGQIEELWRGFMSVFRDVSLETIEVEVTGDLAYEVGRYTGTLAQEGVEPASETGKYVVVWKRQTGGTWQLAVDIWNSDTPLPEME